MIHVLLVIVPLFPRDEPSIFTVYHLSVPINLHPVIGYILRMTGIVVYLNISCSGFLLSPLTRLFIFWIPDYRRTSTIGSAEHSRISLWKLGQQDHWSRQSKYSRYPEIVSPWAVLYRFGITSRITTIPSSSSHISAWWGSHAGIWAKPTLATTPHWVLIWILGNNRTSVGAFGTMLGIEDI